MKKALLLTAVILALSLNACGGKSSENSLTSDDRTTAQNNSSIEATVGATELLEDATDHTGTESQPWASTAAYINAGCVAATGDKIRHMTGNSNVEIVSASLTDSMKGLFTGYNEGKTSLEAVLFTAKDGRTVYELKDTSTDCIIIFDKMIIVDANYNSYHLFGQINGMFEGTQYDGSNVLLQMSDGGWCEMYICQGDTMLVEDYRLQQIPSESAFITAENEWIGSYVTDEYVTEKAEIIIRADEYGLTHAEINSTIYQGTVWCFMESSTFYSEYGKVIAYDAPDYDSDCRCLAIQFGINELTGLCEYVNYNIVGNAGLINGTAYREKEYIAPATLENQDKAGVWGLIPVHDADAQYFTPMTEDYLVEYMEKTSMPLDNTWTEYTDVQMYTLYSYNEVGKVINKKEKYVCIDAATAQKVTLVMQERLQERHDEKPIELTCVDNIIYQYETDDIDYNPSYLNNEKLLKMSELDTAFFFGRHLMEEYGDYGHTYYWFSKIMTEEEGRQYNQNYNEYFKPYTGHYYRKDAEKTYANAIILYSNGLFDNSINVPFKDQYNNTNSEQTNIIRINQDGTLTAIDVIYDQFYVVAELTFSEDKTTIAGHYYQYSIEGGCPTFEDYKTKEYYKEGDLGEYVFSLEEW